MFFVARHQADGVHKPENFAAPKKTAMRLRLVALAWISVVLTLLATSSVPASADTVADERQFVQLINELRVDRGLAPLLVDSQLKLGSRGWSQGMASRNVLEHATDLSAGISSNWTLLGENVGVTNGNNVQRLFDEFVASPEHLRNLVDPQFTYVGVGVVYDAGGRLWTTHRFMAVSDANPKPAPPPATSPPAPPGPTTPPRPATPPKTVAPPKTDTVPKTGTPLPVLPNLPPEPERTVTDPSSEDPSVAPPPSGVVDEALVADVLKELESA